MDAASHKQETEPGYVFVRVWHPHLNLCFVGPALALRTRRRWTAGRPRTTPTGQRLHGVWPQSYWCSVGLAFDDARAFETVMRLLPIRLTRAERTLQRLTRSGGRLELAVQMPGSRNVGGTLLPPVLKTLGELGIALSIEVFPNMRQIMRHTA